MPLPLPLLAPSGCTPGPPLLAPLLLLLVLFLLLLLLGLPLLLLPLELLLLLRRTSSIQGRWRQAKAGGSGGPLSSCALPTCPLPGPPPEPCAPPAAPSARELARPPPAPAWPPWLMGHPRHAAGDC